MVSPCLNVLTPVRTIRKRLGQHGSGHATSASVDIQSFVAVMRCFAASRGRTAPRGLKDALSKMLHAEFEDVFTQGVYRDSLTLWEVEHLPFEREVVSLFCATHDSFSGWADNFDA